MRNCVQQKILSCVLVKFRLSTKTVFKYICLSGIPDVFKPAKSLNCLFEIITEIKVRVQQLISMKLGSEYTVQFESSYNGNPLNFTRYLVYIE